MYANHNWRVQGRKQRCAPSFMTSKKQASDDLHWKSKQTDKTYEKADTNLTFINSINYKWTTIHSYHGSSEWKLSHSLLYLGGCRTGALGSRQGEVVLGVMGSYTQPAIIEIIMTINMYETEIMTYCMGNIYSFLWITRLPAEWTNTHTHSRTHWQH